MIHLNICVKEQVSISKLQRKRLTEAGLLDFYLSTSTKKEAYEQLIKAFLPIYKKLSLQGGGNGGLGKKVVVTMIASLVQTYLIKFCSASKRPLKFKAAQDMATGLLSSFEEGTYDTITRKIAANWGKLRKVDEIFTKGALHMHGKISITISVVDAEGAPIVSVSQGHVIMKDFLISIKKLVEEYEQQKAIVSDLDLELSDVVHEIEFLDNGASSREKEIRKNRQARRQAKDRMELLEPVYNWVTGNGSVGEAENVLSAIMMQECYHRTREYSYKSSAYKDKGVITHNGV